MLMIELPMATPPLAMTAEYKETDVTIRIRPNRYYSAEYRIAVHPTIRPEANTKRIFGTALIIILFVIIIITIIITSTIVITTFIMVGVITFSPLTLGKAS